MTRKDDFAFEGKCKTNTQYIHFPYDLTIYTHKETQEHKNAPQTKTQAPILWRGRCGNPFSAKE